MRKYILAIVYLAISPMLFAQLSLNNEAVIKMVKAGLSDDLIITTISLMPGSYDATPEGLIALKSAGASDKVVGAIVAKAAALLLHRPRPHPCPRQSRLHRHRRRRCPVSPPLRLHRPLLLCPPLRLHRPMPAVPAPPPSAPAAAAPALPPGIDLVGVYYQDSGAWKPIAPEIVTEKSAGFSVGDNKVGSIKGHIIGARAHASAPLPVSLAVYVPEGRSIAEYRLIRLLVKTSDREFHISSSLISKASNDNEIDKDAVMITSEKIAPRVYQIILSSSLGRGEYGLLAPRPRWLRGRQLENLLPERWQLEPAADTLSPPIAGQQTAGPLRKRSWPCGFFTPLKFFLQKGGVWVDDSLAILKQFWRF